MMKDENSKRHQSIIIFFFFIVLIILNGNIDFHFLSNGHFTSKEKKFRYFSKYFQTDSFINMNITYLNKISLINEIISLNNIRKEINCYRNISFANIHFKKFSKVIYPKLSLIITLYNQKNHILKIYSCILNQTLKNIEIIFIDDNSNDNSFPIIKKIMEFDNRIIYIRNKFNKGQFYSRNRAALISKGKYIQIIDPDDFLLNDILSKSYKVSKKFNLDILQFYHVIGNFTKNHLYILNQDSRIIYDEKVKNIFFKNPTRYLWDKLIKKDTFVKSINFMHKKYRKERFIIHNDETVCFGIFKTGKSYGQIEEVGYFYNRNSSNSTTKLNFLPENINGRFHCIFTIMKYYYEQSENCVFEKVYGGYNFFTYRIIRKYENKIRFLTKGFEFILNVIDIYLKSPFFNDTQKELLNRFSEKIHLQQIKIEKKYIFLA